MSKNSFFIEHRILGVNFSKIIEGFKKSIMNIPFLETEHP